MEAEGWRFTETNAAPRNNVSGIGCALWHQRLTKTDPSAKVGKNGSEKRPTNNMSMFSPVVSTLPANMCSSMV